MEMSTVACLKQNQSGRRRLALRLVVALFVLASCSSSTEETATSTTQPTTTQPTTTTAPPVTADSVLTDAGAALAVIETLHFSITHEGAAVFIDADDIVAFDEADGRFAAPGSADALVGVTAAGLTAEIGAVAIDGDVWITNPLTNRWEVAPDAFRFDPARIFSSEVGLSVLLTDGLSDAVLESPEPDSQGRFHISAAVDAEQVATLTSGLVKDVSNVEIWIDAETSLLTETQFVVDTTEGATSWILLLSDYGSEVVIAAPEIG